MFKSTNIISSFRYLVLALGALLLGACAGFGDSPHYVVSPPGECCESFDEMAFKALPAKKKVRLSIDGEDPGFSFEGGYSRYEALLLPDLPKSYILQLESEVVRSAEDSRGTVFFPVLTFLDANKKKIRTFDSLPYTLQTPIYSRNHIRASVRISGELTKAKYVIVHTQDDKLNHALAISDGESLVRAGGFNTMVYAPLSDARYRINFAKIGWVRVRAFVAKG